MISGSKNISDAFSVFHDGEIGNCQLTDSNSLTLEIKIPYLAERIHPQYTKFILTIRRLSNISLKETDSIISDIVSIFARIKETDILSSKENNNIIEVFLSSDDLLILQADSISVHDQANKEYTLDELWKISEAYWKEWESKIPKK